MYQRGPELVLPALGAGNILPIGIDKMLSTGGITAGTGKVVPGGFLPSTGIINHNSVLTMLYAVALSVAIVVAIASSLYVHYKKRHA